MNQNNKAILIAAQNVQRDVDKILPSLSIQSNISKPQIASDSLKNDIYYALLSLSETLANSYLQVKIDIQNDSRLSWAGTAHEIRQMLSTLLEILAPDTTILEQSWYKQEPQTKGPTQKQRVRLILDRRSAGSKEKEVLEQVTTMDELIGNIVRATYSRASDAAHRFKAKGEVSRILRYFEAFSHDLLNL